MSSPTNNAGAHMGMPRTCDMRFCEGPSHTVAADRLQALSPVLFSWWRAGNYAPLHVRTVSQEMGELLCRYMKFGPVPPWHVAIRSETDCSWLRSSLADVADYLCMDELQRLLRQSAKVLTCLYCGRTFLASDNHPAACHYRPTIRRGSDWICTQCGQKTSICNSVAVCGTVAGFHVSVTE